MKSRRYFNSTFVLFVGVLCISFPVSVLCGETVSGKTLQLSSEDRDTLAVLGEGVVGKAPPALPLAGIEGLMPLITGEWVYRITAGGNRGEQQTDSIGRSENAHADKPWRRMVGKKYIEYFRVIEGGRLLEISEADLSEDVITHYDPPIVDRSYLKKNVFDQHALTT